MNTEVKIIMIIAIAIFVIFIYTLFFFNLSKNIEFWTKQKRIHLMLKKYITKSKSINNNKLKKSFEEISILFRDKRGDIHYNKMYKLLNSMAMKKDYGDKYWLNALLSKMQKEQKFLNVSKSFQILFNDIDKQLLSNSFDKEHLQTNIILLYNKIGEIETEINISKKGYWVGLASLIITILSIIYSIIK